jgi:hypothetical protein
MNRRLIISWLRNSSLPAFLLDPSFPEREREPPLDEDLGWSASPLFWESGDFSFKFYFNFPPEAVIDKELKVYIAD